MQAIIKLIFLFYPIFLRAQFDDYKVYDTVAFIKTVKLSDKSIKIIEKDYTIYFDKNITIDTITNILTELRGQKKLKDWQLSTIQQIERVKNFIENQKYIEWENVWNNEPNKNNRLIPIDKITNDRELTKRLFLEIACPMITNGQFELIVNGEIQNIVLKTNSYTDDTYATVYKTENKKAFWLCPPIMIVD